MDARTDAVTGRNIKWTHIWVPLIERLRSDGYDVELLSPNAVPNREVRYYQAQADILADMLRYGFVGATAREGIMLGKPVVCNLRSEWLEQMRAEIPDYVAELPVMDAGEETVEEIVRGLVDDSRRREVGKRSREFAVKWHAASRGGAAHGPHLQ